MFVGQLCCFQQGSSSVYIVLGETSQRRKCLTDTQMWTSNCINIKDGRGIGGLRGFKETVLAGKMKTNMASKAANQELKIEIVLPPHYISQTCSFSAAWRQLEKAFMKQGVDPKVPKLSCGLAAGFRGLAVLNPTCYWGSNTGKSCKYTTPTLQSACRHNLLIFCPLTQFLGLFIPLVPFAVLVSGKLAQQQKRENWTVMFLMLKMTGHLKMGLNAAGE